MTQVLYIDKNIRIATLAFYYLYRSRSYHFDKSLIGPDGEWIDLLNISTTDLVIRASGVYNKNKIKSKILSYYKQFRKNKTPWLINSLNQYHAKGDWDMDLHHNRTARSLFSMLNSWIALEFFVVGVKNPIPNWFCVHTYDLYNKSDSNIGINTFCENVIYITPNYKLKYQFTQPQHHRIARRKKKRISWIVLFAYYAHNTQFFNVSLSFFMIYM